MTRDYLNEHERHIVAQHEAAHAVVTLALGLGVEYVTVSRYALTPETQTGHVQFTKRMGEFDARQIAMICLAGILTEERSRRESAALKSGADAYFVDTAILMTAGDPVAVRERYTVATNAYLTLHRDWIAAVAAALLRKGRLTGEEVRALDPRRISNE